MEKSQARTETVPLSSPYSVVNTVQAGPSLRVSNWQGLFPKIIPKACWLYIVGRYGISEKDVKYGYDRGDSDPTSKLRFTL